VIRRFLDRLGDRAQLSGEGLDALVVAGEARLPHKPITRDAFVDRIADGLLAGDGPVTSLEDVCAADLYLACALGKGDAKALAIFEAEFLPMVRQSVGKVDSAKAFVDEVSQRVREKLLVGEEPAIDQYRGTGPLSRWVRVIATRVALDLKRADSKLSDDDDDAVASLPAPDDPELEVIWRTCAVEYKAALTQAFGRLTAKDRTLLRQRFIDDLDIEALGRVHRVHPSTVFRWIEKITERLAEETRASLMDKLRLSESQAHSMERMVASQIQLSLPRLLRGGKRER